eukprot:m.475670 g.475670  ORF g.475670 m.475670 type:complete len:297 (-) comp57144_c0_seq18:27-917(-)
MWTASVSSSLECFLGSHLYFTDSTLRIITSRLSFGPDDYVHKVQDSSKASAEASTKKGLSRQSSMTQEVDKLVPQQTFNEATMEYVSLLSSQLEGQASYFLKEISRFNDDFRSSVCYNEAFFLLSPSLLVAIRTHISSSFVLVLVCFFFSKVQRQREKCILAAEENQRLRAEIDINALSVAELQATLLEATTHHASLVKRCCDLAKQNARLRSTKDGVSQQSKDLDASIKRRLEEKDQNIDLLRQEISDLKLHLEKQRLIARSTPQQRQEMAAGSLMVVGSASTAPAAKKSPRGRR